MVVSHPGGTCRDVSGRAVRHATDPHLSRLRGFPPRLAGPAKQAEIRVELVGNVEATLPVIGQVVLHRGFIAGVAGVNMAALQTNGGVTDRKVFRSGGQAGSKGGAEQCSQSQNASLHGLSPCDPNAKSV